MRTLGCAPPCPRGSQWTSRGTLAVQNNRWERRMCTLGCTPPTPEDRNGPTGHQKEPTGDKGWIPSDIPPAAPRIAMDHWGAPKPERFTHKHTDPRAKDGYPQISHPLHPGSQWTTGEHQFAGTEYPTTRQAKDGYPQISHPPHPGSQWTTGGRLF